MHLILTGGQHAMSQLVQNKRSTIRHHRDLLTVFFMSSMKLFVFWKWVTPDFVEDFLRIEFASLIFGPRYLHENDSWQLQTLPKNQKSGCCHNICFFSFDISYKFDHHIL